MIANFYLCPLLLSLSLCISTALAQTPSTNSPPVDFIDPATKLLPVRHETLIVSERLLTVNCTHQRLSVVINETSPGPELRFVPYERVIINVVNLLPNHNFTMHWHGLSMAGSPWSDGTPLISQWPIPPNSSFAYEFIIRPEDVGTYFYHSHVELQITTASGPLIIDAPNTCSTSKKSGLELMMYVQDFWYRDDKEVMQGLTADPFVWPGSSNAIFLNGRSNGTSGGDDCFHRYPVIDVNPASSYRVRWIHAGALMYVAIGMEAHNMTVIEADGTDLKPHLVKHIEVAPGQRMSTRLITKSLEEVQADGQDGLYLIKLGSRWRNPGVQNFGILRYNMSMRPVQDRFYIDLKDTDRFSPSKSAYQLPAATFGWEDKHFQALIDVPAPDNVNRSLITLSSQLRFWGSKGVTWLVNGKAYHESNLTMGRAPYLIQLYDHVHPLPSISAAETGPQIYDPVTDTYVLEAGQVVDILIQNRPSPTNTTDIHPWHFHSRKFWILAHGQGGYNESTLRDGRFPHPYRRDMVNVYPSLEKLEHNEVGGWALIRYQASADDAGVFPAHCHLAPHQLNGMLVIFVVSPSTLPAILNSYEPYSKYGGEMYGNATYVPPPPSYFAKATVVDEEQCVASQDRLFRSVHICTVASHSKDKVKH